MAGRQNIQYKTGMQKSYPPEASQAAFLLGGIGTGTVSVGSRGNLHDWEIFNSPSRNCDLPNSFFCIRVKRDGEAPAAKVLEAEYRPPYTQRSGLSSGKAGGLPRFRTSLLRGEYPLVWVDFLDESFPVQVIMEAFTPFIPLNADDSGIPAAIVRYTVKNNGHKDADVLIAGSLANASGFAGFDAYGNMRSEGEACNEFRDQGDCRGLFLTNKTLQPHQLNYGNLALITRDPCATAKPCWHTTGGWDGLQDFWDRFYKDGKVDEQPADTGRTGPGIHVGSLAIRHTLAPGEEKCFEFILAWYFPTRTRCCDGWQEKKDGLIVRNYYATLFDSAWHAGLYTILNIKRLEKHTRDFHGALFGSTLPSFVLDAVSSNITTLRSNTCFRLENGAFAGWEGCNDYSGSCFGTCTHVWNYAQTVAFLFPELERSARETELLLETDDEGLMSYRTNQVFGQPKFQHAPAADGQMGVIVRLYREWKLSGDPVFLQKVWPKAAKALDFAFTYWDTDGDLLFDGTQHNTYDIDFHGPNPLSGSMFLAALKAGSEMAAFIGDGYHQRKYAKAYLLGRKRMDLLLWNKEYYIQKLNGVNEYSYQYGEGCLSDQLLGQSLACIAGLGEVLPGAHVRKALKSIYKYNFRTSFREVTHIQRTYALNDEKGLQLCTWPRGGRPALPFVYSDEVWAGVEYQVAAHMIWEGMIQEGLTLVTAVRDRYDGYKRSPWNEVECGFHYVRSMASWALLTDLCGFRADLVNNVMEFSPRINPDDFRCFWSTGKAWGIYRQHKDESGKIVHSVETLYGSQDVTVKSMNGK
jgi:non-lysosomal glucosylceramidase